MAAALVKVRFSCAANTIIVIFIVILDIHSREADEACRQTAVLAAVGMAAGYRLTLPRRLHLARTRKAAGCGYTRTKALFGRGHRITYIHDAGSSLLWLFCPIMMLPKFLWWDLLSVPEHMIESDDWCHTLISSCRQILAVDSPACCGGIPSWLKPYCLLSFKRTLDNATYNACLLYANTQGGESWVAAQCCGSQNAQLALLHLHCTDSHQKQLA